MLMYSIFSTNRFFFSFPLCSDAESQTGHALHSVFVLMDAFMLNDGTAEQPSVIYFQSFSQRFYPNRSEAGNNQSSPITVRAIVKMYAVTGTG